MRNLVLFFSSFLFLGSLVAAENGEETTSLQIIDEKVAEIEEKLIALEIQDDKLIAATEPGFTPTTAFGPEPDDFVDPKILRDFIESRGLIECRQKSGTLIIAGDVRARWIANAEEVNGISVRGAGTEQPLNVFKSEFNLYMDYSAPKTWLTTKVRYAVVDGTDGGSATKVELDRAFIGYDIYECGKEDFYIELGRSKLDYMFESRVQFGSLFDGIHLYYTKPLGKIGTFTLHGGPFIIDSLTNHYAWVGEVGVKEWMDTGWSFRYSLIDWTRKAPTFDYGYKANLGTIRNNPRYRFLVSQMLISREKKIDFAGCKMLYLYGAVLANHDATRNNASDYTYANKAWYLGFTLGKLCKACDWSIDMNYQYVQAQAIPEFDISGIGHGNAEGIFFAESVHFARTPFEARGFTNYQGLEVNALYALTDTLSLRAKASYSVPINRNIGGDFFFKNFEMAAIYAF
jgi:hypothetical protein